MCCVIFHTGAVQPCGAGERWWCRCSGISELIWNRVLWTADAGLNPQTEQPFRSRGACLLLVEGGDQTTKRLSRGAGSLSPALGFPGTPASRVSRPSESPLPGVQPGGPPTVAEPTPGQSDPGDATPEMRVAGNQGQGPGHNGAIVGLQSVDFQAAVPYPPSLLLPTPDPCQEVTQTASLLISLGPKEAAFWVLPLEAPTGRSCIVCSFHQVATEHHISERLEGGKGRLLNH